MSPSPETEIAHDHEDMQLSWHDVEMFRLDVRSLMLAVDRGSVSMAEWLLHGEPRFLEWGLEDPGSVQAIQSSLKWLDSAREKEAINGAGSCLKREHPVNIKIDAALRR